MSINDIVRNLPLFDKKSNLLIRDSCCKAKLTRIIKPLKDTVSKYPLEIVYIDVLDHHENQVLQDQGILLHLLMIILSLYGYISLKIVLTCLKNSVISNL